MMWMVYDDDGWWCQCEEEYCGEYFGQGEA